MKKNGQKVAINFYGSHLLRPTAVIILYHLNIYIYIERERDIEEIIIVFIMIIDFSRELEVVLRIFV